MRSDAVRNRERILAAARDLVARDGEDMRMELLAQRAGVAVGTLYRHFPTKQDLVAAIVDESLERIAALAETARDRVTGGADPLQELTGLFRDVADHYACDRAVKQAAVNLGLDVASEPTRSPADSAAGRATTAITAVLEAGHVAGTVDPNMGVEDLAMLISRVPDGPDAHARTRYVDVVARGMRR